MDLKGLLSLNFLLFLSLAFEPSCGTDPQRRKNAIRLHFLLTERSSQNPRGFTRVRPSFLPLLTEQVSTPEIKVLNWTQESGNCSLTLACEVEKGDHVAYSWREETGADPPISANSSHLHLSLGPQHVHNVYVCTVSNPIGNHSQTFTPWSVCMPDPPELRPWGLYVGLSSGAIIGVILTLKVAVLLLRRRGKANHYQSTTEAKSLTIYAQVQKSGSIQKKPDAPSAQDPCTTIYVAATEPVPEPVQQPPQEPKSITVYASVTLPES
ncbi:signaling lymphocytic activation molecule [Puma concolor]|uniref:Signaling lymphocytic activation molecule n=1 Tax=Puma concolor TaxID=9696 RepID=A0A6P6H671_PUMCO|nr:signaling lymphocytic activation molecule [Puma concolor]